VPDWGHLEEVNHGIDLTRASKRLKKVVIGVQKTFEEKKINKDLKGR